MAPKGHHSQAKGWWRCLRNIHHNAKEAVRDKNAERNSKAVSPPSNAV